jgi:hypothetical protein
MSGSGHDLNAFANTSWIKINLQTQESWLLAPSSWDGKEGTPDFFCRVI